MLLFTAFLTCKSQLEVNVKLVVVDLAFLCVCFLTFAILLVIVSIHFNNHIVLLLLSREGIWLDYFHFS